VQIINKAECDDEISERIFEKCQKHRLIKVLIHLAASKKTPVHILKRMFSYRDEHGDRASGIVYYTAMNKAFPESDLVDHIDALLEFESLFCLFDDAYDTRAYEIINTIKQYKPLIQ
jgi:hypothetical protein